MKRMLLVLSTVAALAQVYAAKAHAQRSDRPSALRVAAMPISNFAPLLVAEEKDFFSEQGLKVTWSNVNQGALAVEAVYGGSAEIGGGGVLEPMIARGNGLQISFIAANAKMRDSLPDSSSLLVSSSGSIKAPKDLEGKIVSSGLVNSVNYVNIIEWMRKNSVDSKKIQFVELPFPQMVDALAQKRVDAIFVGDPFRLVAIEGGQARILANPYFENRPGMAITAFIAKDSWIKANAEVVARFRLAIDKATAYLIAAPKAEVDDYIARYTALKPEITSRSTFSEFTTRFDVKSLEYSLGLITDQKIVKPFDVKTMIWKP